MRTSTGQDTVMGLLDDRPRGHSPSLRGALARGEVTSVHVLGPTAQGWRALPVPAGAFLAAADSVADADGESLLPPTPCTPQAHTGEQWLTTHLAADLTTLRLTGWAPGTGLALADATDGQGQAHPASPRHILRERVPRLQDAGLALQLQSTTTFTVPGATPAAADTVDEFLVTLDRHLRATGLALDDIKAAKLPKTSAVTLALRASDVLTACDNHAVARYAAAQIAELSGLHADFGTATAAAGCALEYTVLHRGTAASPSGEALVSLTTALTGWSPPCVCAAQHAPAAGEVASHLRRVTAHRGSGVTVGLHGSPHEVHTLAAAVADALLLHLPPRTPAGRGGSGDGQRDGRRQ
jgi:hypothetical protein